MAQKAMSFFFTTAAVLVVLMQYTVGGVVQYAPTSGNVVLNPKIPTGRLIRIVWKHNNDKAVEWDLLDEVPSSYREFKRETRLNTTTGELTVCELTSQFSGNYVAEYVMEGILIQYVFTERVEVIDSVLPPQVTCVKNITGVTVTCDATGPMIKYQLSGPGQNGAPWSKLPIIDYFDATTESFEYTCRAKNPVSEKNKTLTSKDCDSLEDHNVLPIVISCVAAVVVVVYGILMCIRKKHRKYIENRSIQSNTNRKKMNDSNNSTMIGSEWGNEHGNVDVRKGDEWCHEREGGDHDGENEVGDSNGEDENIQTGWVRTRLNPAMERIRLEAGRVRAWLEAAMERTRKETGRVRTRLETGMERTRLETTRVRTRLETGKARTPANPATDPSTELNSGSPRPGEESWNSSNGDFAAREPLLCTNPIVKKIIADIERRSIQSNTNSNKMNDSNNNTMIGSECEAPKVGTSLETDVTTTNLTLLPQSLPQRGWEGEDKVESSHGEDKVGGLEGEDKVESSHGEDKVGEKR